MQDFHKNNPLFVIRMMILILSLVGVNYLIYKVNNDSGRPKVQSKDQDTKNDMFAIMLQQNDGTYKTTDSKSFKQAGYVFNSAKSGCVGTNGKKIDSTLTYNNTTNTVTLVTNKAAFCYVYFDKKQYDIDVTIKTDGVSGTLPTTGGYKNALVCSEGTGTFNNKYQRLEVTDVKAKCTLKFEKDMGTHTNLANTVQSASGIVNEGDAGYRYEGTDPNNYIWFNNEMWRIIGSIPTKVDASGTTTNLVKIIRNDILGSIVYDAKASGYTGTWGDNTLYTLLNNYYYGKKNGTNTAYCYGEPETAKTKCDYSISGISNASTDYYGRMVKSVYWKTGASSHNATANESYTNEKATQTVQGRIGIMNASDFGFAANSANHNSTKLSEYGPADITISNWLYNQGYEWTNTQYSNNASDVLRVNGAGIVINFNGHGANSGNPYRPVVYLDENVYVISGNGTEANPYIIGM